MIKVCRVDHRLLHGQVAFAWIKAVGADCILIASDEVAADELRSAALRMAKPTGTKLVIKSINDSAQAINSGVTDKYGLFILCESIHDAYRLAKMTPAISEIDLGGAKSEAGRRGISPAVYVSDTDCDNLRELVESGVSCYVQQVPSDPAQDVMGLI